MKQLMAITNVFTSIIATTLMNTNIYYSSPKNSSTMLKLIILHFNEKFLKNYH